MKKLVLGSLMAVLVSQAAGCIISSGNGGDTATVTVNWSLKQQATGQSISCPPGTTTAALYAAPVDANNNKLPGMPYTDLYRCDDHTGTIADVPPDVYQVWVELTSEGGGTVYAQSTQWPNGVNSLDRDDLVDVRASDKTLTTTLLNDGGYFGVTWDLKRTTSGAALDCAQAQADGVGVISTSVANMNSFVDDKFNCEAGIGITGGLLQGAYNVTVDAFSDGPRGGGLGPTTTLNNQIILDKNRITDLGHVRVNID